MRPWPSYGPLGPMSAVLVTTTARPCGMAFTCSLPLEGAGMPGMENSVSQLPAKGASSFLARASACASCAAGRAKARARAAADRIRILRMAWLRQGEVGRRRFPGGLRVAGGNYPDWADPGE